MTRDRGSRPGRRWPGCGWWGGLVLTVLAGAPPLSARQQDPADPIPAAGLRPRELQRRALENGAELIVVTRHEVPFVQVSLVLPGGREADPEGQEGLADLVAELVPRGSSLHPGPDLMRAFALEGASLSARTFDEGISIDVGALASNLPAVLELMAGVVVHPEFPAEDLDTLRTARASSLQGELALPATLASTRFARRIYGDHSYGRLPTPASIRAVDRRALNRYHSTWFRPAGALFVIVGDIEADSAAAAVTRAFTAWPPGRAPAIRYARPPGRVQPEIVVVHRPGAASSEIRLGHLLPPGGASGWNGMIVAGDVLARRLVGRPLAPPQSGPWRAGGAVAVGVSRRRDRGLFVLGTSVPTAGTAAAVEGMLALVRGLRDAPVTAVDLAETRDLRVASFSRAVETPRQIASRVVADRLLGVDPAELATYAARLAALDARVVQAAARAFLNPQEALIVVVGDAARLRTQLAPLGHVRVESPQGGVLSLADLGRRPARGTFDATGLKPRTLRYRVLVRGEPAGTARRELSRSPEGLLRFASRVEVGARRIIQDVVVADDLLLVSTRAEIVAGADTLTLKAQFGGGRITGELALAGRRSRIDMAAPDGVMVGDMVELALWLADLDVGREIRVPLANLQTARTEDAILTVSARETLAVPAGTFDAYRVDLEGLEAQTFWLRAEAPHLLLRTESRRQPVVLELAEAPGG